MLKRENVPQERPATSRQMAEVYGMLIKAVPDLSHAQAQHFIGHQRQVARQVRDIFTGTDSHSEQLAHWEFLYTCSLGVSLTSLSGLVIPPKPEGLYRLIVVASGMTIEQTLAAYGAKRIQVWRWTNDDLDALTESVRSATKTPYAVWVRDTAEPDPETAGKSYNQLKAKSFHGITLLERLLDGLKYFMETNKHLDVTNVTRCDGSIYRNDGVPDVYFGGGEVRVHWYDRGNAGAGIRSREVVDFKP